MKKYIILILVFCILSTLINAQSVSKKQPFTIKGELIGKETKLWLIYRDENQTYHSDTCTSKNGLFTFSGLLAESTLAVLRKYHDPREFVVASPTNGPEAKEICIEPGVIKVVLTVGKFKDAVITGSQSQIEHDLLIKLRQHIQKEVDSLSIIGGAISRQKLATTDQSVSDKLELEINKINNLMSKSWTRYFNISYDFVNTHHDSYISPIELIRLQNHISLDTIKHLYNQLNSLVKNSKNGKNVAKSIQIKENNLVGRSAPDFKTIDVNGDTLSLSSFRDKSLIILYFWESWRIPCKEMNVHLKEVYNKYNSKGLDIISISMESETGWLRALKQDSLLNLRHHIFTVGNYWLGDTGEPTENNILGKYDMTFPPVLILIDKKGIILGHWDSQHTKENEIELELDKKLAELIKKE